MKFLKLFLILFAISILKLPCEAKTYVLQITPAQVINIRANHIKTDDSLDFAVVKDVYKNDEIYIAKETPVKATVSYVQEDAWVGDSPLLELRHFETTDVKGNPIIIDYNLKIRGKYGITKPVDFCKYFVKSFFFYANLNYQPKEVAFNVLFEEED